MNRSENLVSRRSVVAAGAVAAGIALRPDFAHGQTHSERGTKAVISVDSSVITLVTTFSGESGTLPRLVDVLREGTESFFSKMPGFVSSSVMTARDGRRAVNYSQWRSNEDIVAFRKDPRFEPYLARLRALATTDGFACDVVYVNAV